MHTYTYQSVSLLSMEQGHYGKVNGQIKVTPEHCTPTLPNQCLYQESNSYTLQNYCSSHLPVQLDAMGENNTCIACKG